MAMPQSQEQFLKKLMKMLQIILKPELFCYAMFRNSYFLFGRTTAILTSLYKLTIITKFHLLSQSNFSLVKSFKNTKNKIITNKLVGLWAWKIHARNTGFVLAISKYSMGV